MSEQTGPDVDVRADGEHRYVAALIRSTGDESRHEVRSDADLLAELGLTAAEEPFLVRRVLELLAEANEDPGAQVPEVIDLRVLDAERPDLLRSLPLRD
ncbi:hypothetical protein ACFFKU_14815 [Kineococcus gynurae]|uniref:Uncharacterized protein n=1 Tax=Kineococcus gynurae TaxID=452979 RepID=A0ABV5LTS7_9ACTN